MTSLSTSRPHLSYHRHGDALAVHLSGSWTLDHLPQLEALLETGSQAADGCQHVRLDASQVERLDSTGAWYVKKKLLLGREDRTMAFEPGSEALAALIQALPLAVELSEPRALPSENLFVYVGRSVEQAGKTSARILGFLGQCVQAVGEIVRMPRHFRLTSLVAHMEQMCLRALPIILLINFLVGCIVAQQGIFQLRRFGASSFVVDLIGILVLRELAVLLTAIMVAGRSGSAITAELGSTKMREEIDALRVMGLDPLQVLILPRLIALTISLPILAFLASLAALFGGLLVSWLYDGLSPYLYLSYLKQAIALNTFMVGIIKAPVMALAIGLIAAREGFAVRGSAESLGRHVTRSVVQAIFIVIVLDGLFAMFFARLNY